MDVAYYNLFPEIRLAGQVFNFNQIFEKIKRYRKKKSKLITAEEGTGVCK